MTPASPNTHTLLVALGSSGDVHPFLGLGRELRRRGHRVTLVAAGWFRGVAEKAGLDFIDPLPELDFVESIADERIWHPRMGTAIILEQFVRPLLEPVYRIIEREVAADSSAGRRTVVVASTLAFGARIAQERLGVPLVSVHLSPVMFRSLDEAPRLPGLLVHRGPHWFRRAQWYLADRLLIDPFIGRWLNPFRATLGLPSARGLLRDWLHSPLLTLGLFPEWFASRQPEWPKHLRLTGFPLYSEEGVSDADAATRAWLEAGPAPILFTPGSANVHGREFFAAAAEACARLGRRGLLLTRFPEQIPAALPAGVRHAEFVPFSWLVPRSAALVHHGGVGTVSQGLAGGVPQVVMPMGFDQFDNAARIERLGVGASLPRDRFRGPRLAEMLAGLLGDGRVADRCREVAARFVGGRGLATAADEVESVIR
jgi:rhamnosyltransferase subunit B